MTVHSTKQPQCPHRTMYINIVSIHVHGLGYIYITYVYPMEYVRYTTVKLFEARLQQDRTTYLLYNYNHCKCLTSWYICNYNPASKLQRIMKSITQKKAFKVITTRSHCLLFHKTSTDWYSFWKIRKL